jgi:uncharacterized protein
MWTKFKKNLCESCWASCCHNMPLEVSVPDLIRLGVIEADRAIENLDSIAKELKNKKLIQKYRKKKMVFVIAQKKNKDCIFLNEERRCSVYEKRPEICRQFPKIGPKPGFCPYRPKSE